MKFSIHLTLIFCLCFLNLFSMDVTQEENHSESREKILLKVKKESQPDYYDQIFEIFVK